MTEPDALPPDFEDPALAALVEQLPEATVNHLPDGAIRLDASGKAVFYSDAERRLSGYRKPVVGHDFFVEIAPCMNNPSFRGRIERALASGKLDIAFVHSNELPNGTMDLDVRIQAAAGGGCWIFLKRSE